MGRKPYPKDRKRRPLAERFWEKVDKRGPDECWPWKGKRDRLGYGVFYIGKKAQIASRIACILAHGPMPEGWKTRHCCDQRWCCNPSHLQRGTQAENVRDMWDRNRVRTFRGEQAGNAKLTEQQVREIRRDYIPGIYGCSQLARKYGVSKVNITKILQRKTWSHLV